MTLPPMDRATLNEECNSDDPYHIPVRGALDKHEVRELVLGSFRAWCGSLG